MRVISGKFKGKKLFAPADKRVRPTTDRIKETLFNILYSKGKIEGEVLDLFSGTGALGIEALSRGASRAVFVDKDCDSIKLTVQNLTHVKADGYEIYNTDFTIALKKLYGRKFDIIFIDPPYRLKAEAEILNKIANYELLNKNGIIIIEHSKENNLQIEAERYIIDERNCGNTVLTFLTNRSNRIE